MKKHSGHELNGDFVLFQEAPEEIGPVQSAESSLVKGTPAGPPLARRGRNTAIAAVVGYVIGYVVLRNFSFVFAPLYRINYEFFSRYMPLYYMPWFIAALLGVLAWFLTNDRHACSYVGRDGLAFFWYKNSPQKMHREVFRFADAAELRKGVTRHYRNGRYEGTSFFFRWTDAAGKKVFALESGAHPRTPGHDWFELGNAAEMAWSVHLFERSKAEIAQSGMLKFTVTGSDWIGVAPGALEISFKGKTGRCEKRDVDFVSVKNGVFTIKKKGGQVGWFSSDGVFTFPYQSMANARLFLFAIEKLAGITVST